MRKKKVGTFTMAVVLIVSGILMLIAQILNISALEYFIKFWPVTLFLLGGEVIYFHFKYRKDDDIKIGYDFFSIIIVLIIIGVTSGIHSLMKSGVLEGIKNIGSMETKVYTTEVNEFVISENIEKIIVENMEETDVTIKTGEDDKLDVMAEFTIPNIKNKDREIDIEDLINIDESGKVLYLTLDFKNKNENIQSLYDSNIIITLPSDKVLDISKVKDVNMRITEIEEDILINDANNIKINIDNPIDYYILAHLSDDERFLGTIDWNIEKAKNNLGDIVYFVGEAKKGSLEHTIKVLNSKSIEVNNL